METESNLMFQSEFKLMQDREQEILQFMNEQAGINLAKQHDDDIEGQEFDDRDFEVKNKDDNGRTILHRAALQQSSLTLKSQFDKGKSWKPMLQQRDNYGNTPLGLACINGADTYEKKMNKWTTVNLLLE